MQSINIVGLGGSMKGGQGGSSSVATLAAALQGARAAGAETRMFELRLLNLPMFVPDSPPSDAVHELINAVGDAHGMIWSSPVYHGGMSGAFKNALDWLELLSDRQPAYLTDKVVGLISTAGGIQGLQAINTMEYVVRALRGWTLPFTVPLDRAGQAFDGSGQLRDEDLVARLRKLGEEVALAAARWARPGPARRG